MPSLISDLVHHHVSPIILRNNFSLPVRDDLKFQAISIAIIHRDIKNLRKRKRKRKEKNPKLNWFKQ